MRVGRPKDLAKRQLILAAAKTLFLSHGFHGSSMNQIAQHAGVTKLTIYNHFQDKNTLFACAIAETCEAAINTQPIQLQPDSNFIQVLHQVCELTLHMVNLPEAIKLEHLLFELTATHNPLAQTFFQASHQRLFEFCSNFFQHAKQCHFIDADQVEQPTQLLLSLLFGQRHHDVLLGVRDVPTHDQMQQIIVDAIEIFMLKYRPKPT